MRHGYSFQTSLRPNLLVRAFFWTATGDAATRVATLLVTVVAARAVSQDGFALYLGFSAVALIAAALWDFGINAVLTREVASGRVSPSKALGRLVSVRIRTVPLWLFVFASGSLILTRDHPVALQTTLAFAGMSLVIGIHGLLLATLRGLLQFRGAVASVAAGRWVTALLSAIVLPAAGSSALTWLAVACLSGEAFTLIAAACVLLRRAGSEGASGQTEVDSLTLRAAAPFAANGILSTAYNRLDIVIVGALASSVSMGQYAPASRIQDMLYAIPGTIGAVVLPLMSRAWPLEDGRAQVQRIVVQTLTVGLAIAVPITIAASLFAPQLLELVLGPDYRSAAAPTRILVWFLPLAVVQAPLLARLAASGHAADTSKVVFSTFLIACAAHLALDPWAGASGAALASLTRDIGAVPIAILLVRKRRRAEELGRLTYAGSATPSSRTDQPVGTGHA